MLDDRDTAAAAHAEWRGPQALQRLRATFRYGWTTDAGQMRAYVEECVRGAPGDWLNAGARPALVREVVRRCFRQRGEQWVRRPTIQEIEIVGSPDPAAAIYPSADVYDHVTCPMTIVLASAGRYAGRGADARRITDGRPERVLIEIESNHNVPMTRPNELAAAIRALLHRVPA